MHDNRFTHYLARRLAPPPSVGQQLDLFGHPRDAEREQHGFLARILLLALLLLAGVGLLAMRISYLTLARGEALYDLCERNYIAQEKIPAPRGMITDRHGIVIATSEPRFDLSVSPFQLQAAQVEQTLAGIARFLPDQRLPSAADVLHTVPRWKRLRVASNLTSEQATPLLERQGMLPGLVIEQGFRRTYPQGHVTSLITGYVSAIPEDKQQQEKYLEEGYDRDDWVGRMGLEREFEKDLRGEKGTEIVYRDAKGRLRDSRVLQDASAGARVVLTIDMRLQNLAADLLANTSGTLVALDPRNGEVLAMVSNPDFDANDPKSASRLGNSSYNKALRSYYSPGSTFKIVTASSWLIAGKGTPQRTVDCEGQFDLGSGKHMNCMLRSGHGPVAMTEGFAVSCNVFFSQLASELDTDDFLDISRRFGYGQPTGITLHGLGDAGLLGPRSGTPAPTRTDRVMMGVGQGRLIAVTPLQMAVAYSTVANGGTRYGARIVRSVERPGAAQPEEWLPTALDQVPWTPAQHQAVLDGLRAVIEAPNGTGRHGKFDPAWHVAGKTGTAETGREDPDAWFVCFAPYENPEICVAILIEQGGHGGEVAAPLARTFLEEYFRFR